MELKRDEIIKALECCKTTTPEDCIECPYRNKGNSLYTGCVNTLVKDTLSLINELTAKTEAQDIVITELRKCLDKANHDADRYARKIKELTEENERLIDECGNQSTLWRQHFESIYETAKDTLKADTVREMRKEIEARCIKGGIYPAFVKSTINQIAEEMIGGNNANKED